MTKLSEVSDNELESMWQAQCTTIQMALTEYYKPNGDEKYRVFAEEAQKKQSEIQDEITRRSH